MYDNTYYTLNTANFTFNQINVAWRNYNLYITAIFKLNKSSYENNIYIGITFNVVFIRQSLGPIYPHYIDSTVSASIGIVGEYISINSANKVRILITNYNNGSNAMFTACIPSYKPKTI